MLDAEPTQFPQCPRPPAKFLSTPQLPPNSPNSPRISHFLPKEIWHSSYAPTRTIKAGPESGPAHSAGPSHLTRQPVSSDLPTRKPATVHSNPTARREEYLQQNRYSPTRDNPFRIHTYKNAPRGGAPMEDTQLRCNQYRASGKRCTSPAQPTCPGIVSLSTVPHRHLPFLFVILSAFLLSF